MRGFVATIAIALLLVSCVNAHLCMWSPMQRGDFSISQPGYSGCYQKVGPCGVDTPGPITTIKAMNTFTVEFQQNLNHYYVNQPGYLDVSWAPKAQPVESDFTFVGPKITDYNAMNEVAQTNFSVAIAFPNVTFDHGVLRVRYVSNNPMENDRGTTFYQCADIKVVAAVPGPAPPEPPGPPSTPGTPCCTPKQFTTDFYRVDSYTGLPAHGTVYYDATTQFMRVDFTVGDDPKADSTSYQFIMNFTSGVGYYYVPATDLCPLRGLDYWNDWCYGTEGQSEYFTGSVAYGDMLADVWQNGEFSFVNEHKTCIPLSLARSTGDTTVYYNFEAGAPDPAVFNPPAKCLSQSALQQPLLRRSNEEEMPPFVLEVLKSLRQ